MSDNSNSRSDNKHNNLRKLLTMLLNESKEKFNLLNSDLFESIFLASGFQRNGTQKESNGKESNKDYFTFIAKKYKDMKSIFNDSNEGSINNLFSSLESIVKLEKIEDYHLYTYHANRCKLHRIFESIENDLNSQILLLTELLDSTSPRLNNILRHNRKVERDTINILEKIAQSYIEQSRRIYRFILGYKAGEYEKENAIMESVFNTVKKSLTVYINYFLTTKYTSSSADEIKMLNESKNEKSIINTIQLAYWAATKPNYLNFISHEINLSVLKYISNKNNFNGLIENKNDECQKISNFNENLDLIRNSIFSLFNTYRNGFDNATPLSQLGFDLESYLEKAIVDLLSVLTSGPSYFFSLFTHLTTLEPITPFVNKLQIPAIVRLKLLYLFVKEIYFETKNDSIKKDCPVEKNDYYLAMLEAANKYLIFWENNTIGSEDSITYELRRRKTEFTTELTNVLYAKMKGCFSNLFKKNNIEDDKKVQIDSRFPYYWIYGEIQECMYYIPDFNTLNITDLKSFYKLIYGNENDNFRWVPNKSFWIFDDEYKALQPKMEHNGIFFHFSKHNILITELIWSHVLNYYYNNIEINNQKHIPSMRIARLLSGNLRKELFNYLLSQIDTTKDKKLYLRKPTEWILIEMNLDNRNEKFKQMEMISFDKKNNKEINKDSYRVNCKYDRNNEKAFLLDLMDPAKIDYKEKKDDKINGGLLIWPLNVLGEYDFFLEFKHCFTRRKVDYCNNWLPLWTKEEKTALSGEYRFRRYLCEKFYSTVVDQNKKEIPLQVTDETPFILLIFLEITNNMEESTKNQDLFVPIKDWIDKNTEKDRKFELFFSSSWNDLFFKIGFSDFKELKDILSDDLFKQPYKTNTVILYNENNSLKKSMKLESGCQTSIALKNSYQDVPVEIKDKLKEFKNEDKDKNKIEDMYYTLGLSDVMIKWNSNVEINDINEFIRSLIFTDKKYYKQKNDEITKKIGAKKKEKENTIDKEKKKLFDNEINELEESRVKFENEYSQLKIKNVSTTINVKEIEIRSD